MRACGSEARYFDDKRKRIAIPSGWWLSAPGSRYGPDGRAGRISDEVVDASDWTRNRGPRRRGAHQGPANDADHPRAAHSPTVFEPDDLHSQGLVSATSPFPHSKAGSTGWDLRRERSESVQIGELLSSATLTPSSPNGAFGAGWTASRVRVKSRQPGVYHEAHRDPRNRSFLRHHASRGRSCFDAERLAEAVSLRSRHRRRGRRARGRRPVLHPGRSGLIVILA